MNQKIKLINIIKLKNKSFKKNNYKLQLKVFNKNFKNTNSNKKEILKKKLKNYITIIIFL